MSSVHIEGLPAVTKRPEDVPLWSYFSRDVPDYHRTKIGRIKFLTYFGSAISGMHLASGNMKNFPKTLFRGKCLNWPPEDVPRTSRCRCHFGTFLGRSWDISPKLKEYAIRNFLVSNTHIWWTKTENVTTEMHFVFLFKTYILGTSRERYPPNITLGTL